MKSKISLNDWLSIMAGSFIVAAAVYYIMMPSGIVLGSVSGLALVLMHFIPVPMSMLTLVMNLILLVVGYIFVGKDFGLKTVVSSVVFPLFMAAFERITPHVDALTDDVLINLAAYILILCVGQSILFRINASSGGLDVVAKIINKYLYFDLGVSVMIAGLIASATAIFAYDRKTVVVGFIGTYFAGVILDNFLMGFDIRKKVCILSQEHDMIQKYIVETLRRGTTLYPAYGGKNHSELVEVVTILEKNEYAKLIEYIKAVDPQAFVTVYSVGEVIGQWNDKKRLKVGRGGR